ncbi:MAG: hypothetical protein IJ916_09000 [Paludibacteraceae bacterium]|nr:hypothetical protein [Paludibacteraceae bacterium]
MHQNYDMKSTIKYIASFIILVSSLCSCQSTTTSSMESEGNELESNIDSSANLIDIEEDTIKYFDPNDPLFGECAEYLNACAVNSDDRTLRMYKLNEEYYRWHLIKIESIDGSPIQESIKKRLEEITMGDYRENGIVNGCLTFDYNCEKLNLNELKQKAKQPDSFAENYNEIATYFEKAYKKLGVQVSFDRINMISTKNHVSNWLSCFSICGFAIVGDYFHRCLVVNKKYVLWYSKYKGLATEYELVGFKIDTLNHFFENPLPNYEGLEIDTTMKKIASDKTCYKFYDSKPEGMDISVYDHLIVNDYTIMYEEGGSERFLGNWETPGEDYNVTVLPDYKGYHVIYVNYGCGSTEYYNGVLIVYSDLKTANRENHQLQVESSERPCEITTVQHFDIFEDYTIRVKGRLVERDRNIDKSITRYYRINDEGKFYEVTGREN